MPLNPLPRFYYYFFAFFEPVSRGTPELTLTPRPSSLLSPWHLPEISLANYIQTLILIGAYLCIVTPKEYAISLLPDRVEPVTRIMGSTTRGQMVIGGLGSCTSDRSLPSPITRTRWRDTRSCRMERSDWSGFLLLAMLALSMFPLIRKHLASNPVVQEKMVKGLLVPLAIADVSYHPFTAEIRSEARSSC